MHSCETILKVLRIKILKDELIILKEFLKLLNLKNLGNHLSLIETMEKGLIFCVLKAQMIKNSTIYT